MVELVIYPSFNSFKSINLGVWVQLQLALDWTNFDAILLFGSPFRLGLHRWGQTWLSNGIVNNPESGFESWSRRWSLLHVLLIKLTSFIAPLFTKVLMALAPINKSFWWVIRSLLVLIVDVLHVQWMLDGLKLTSHPVKKFKILEIISSYVRVDLIRRCLKTLKRCVLPQPYW